MLPVATFTLLKEESDFGHVHLKPHEEQVCVKVSLLKVMAVCVTEVVVLVCTNFIFNLNFLVCFQSTLANRIYQHNQNLKIPTIKTIRSQWSLEFGGKSQ